MKITIIVLLALTSCCIRTNAAPRREIQRQVLDGLVRLITKRSFPPLLQEIKRYFKLQDALRKFITDAVIWKSDQIARILKTVRDKVDAIESILWILFKTKSKPKGRPDWEWLDSNYEWTTRRGRKGTINLNNMKNRDYNNNNNNNGDYNGNDGGGEDDGNDDDDDDDGDGRGDGGGGNAW